MSSDSKHSQFFFAPDSEAIGALISSIGQSNVNVIAVLEVAAAVVR